MGNNRGGKKVRKKKKNDPNFQGQALKQAVQHITSKKKKKKKGKLSTTTSSLLARQNNLSPHTNSVNSSTSIAVMFIADNNDQPLLGLFYQAPDPSRLPSEASLPLTTRKKIKPLTSSYVACNLGPGILFKPRPGQAHQTLYRVQTSILDHVYSRYQPPQNRSHHQP